MKRTERRFSSATLASLVALAVGSPVAAEELWVSPTHLAPPALDLLWPVTGAGFAAFGFAVPDDMDSLQSARVVLLPGATVAGNYDVYAEAKRNGEQIDAADVSFSLGNGPTLLVDGVLQEVDVTPVLASLFDGGSAGADYVSLFFWFPTGDPAASGGKAVGLRFEYATAPVATGDLADGAVTAAKLASGAVGSAQVQNESLTASDLASNSVGASELASNSVFGVDIVDGQVSTLDILDGTILAQDIQTGTITSTQIGTNTIAAIDIATGAVTSSEILDNSITTADVATISVSEIDFALGQTTTIPAQCGGIAPKTFVPASTCPFGSADGPPCNAVGLGAFCEYDAGQCGPELDTGLDNCPGSYDVYVRVN